MKVKELIQKLLELDPDLYVFTHGYEGGYNDVVISEPKRIALDVHEEWFYGKHEEAGLLPYSKQKEKKDIVEGIIL